MAKPASTPHSNRVYEQRRRREQAQQLFTTQGHALLSQIHPATAESLVGGGMAAYTEIDGAKAIRPLTDAERIEWLKGSLNAKYSR